VKPEFNDDPKLKAHFSLIVAIICAGLWLRYSLTPSTGMRHRRRGSDRAASAPNCGSAFSTTQQAKARPSASGGARDVTLVSYGRPTPALEKLAEGFA
jgi:hypothetical protein